MLGFRTVTLILKFAKNLGEFCYKTNIKHWQLKAQKLFKTIYKIQAILDIISATGVQ